MDTSVRSLVWLVILFVVYLWLKTREMKQKKAEEQRLIIKPPVPEPKKISGENGITREFFDDFSNLWAAFEEQVKDEIVKRLEELSAEDADTNKDGFSSIYHKIGFRYWCSDKSKGAQWKERIDEVFFDIRYYNTDKLLYQYNNLDQLAAPYLENLNGEQAEEIYARAVKPFLDTRKQELMNAFAEMAKELDHPLPYALKLPVDGQETPLTLGFRKRYKKRDAWDGMDGYTYSFNGRSYTDVRAFQTEAIEMLSDNVSIARDTFGDLVLRRYTEIPTFDSGDREWDSAEIEFLMFDGKDIHLIVLRGGYHIAYLIFFEKLLTADSRMKSIFEKLGWPSDSITWI